MTATSPPLPAPTPLARALSEALRQGLKLQFCRACNSFIYFPRIVCPECWSSSLEWMPISGRGELQSFATIHRSLHPAFGDRTPLCQCSVRLAEGPLVIGLLEKTSSHTPSIGMRVRAVALGIGEDVFVFGFVPED